MIVRPNTQFSLAHLHGGSLKYYRPSPAYLREYSQRVLLHQALLSTPRPAAAILVCRIMRLEKLDQ